jgi:hypothetical protein
VGSSIGPISLHNAIGEVRRSHLPRTPVNKGERRKGRIVSGRLWVE